ncbi:2-amino-4-hydroxy-6-hydroxymethyldihydropteridine diphosphokinase [Salinispora mooreana]|uniref:2-amino-4-hydroxy-6- hydroxymethyldihydropteridine diphosphokinase n=1 Tax=Salinispora mooreana TaxID=999545 RepID=UPI00035E62F0|nr:2-amino-4-hydroxy-6-hydroxymethyldihydropteridine diphosphokinase [Salinispora mooreana]
MTRALLSLGSNLGGRADHLQSAVTVLGESVLLVSGVYETPPWGDRDQPAYLNAAVLAEDPEAAPEDWLVRAQAAERAAGRERDPARHFGPRTLDVDIIVVWTQDGAPVLRDDPELTLPHPRAHLRAFVLRPWLDLQPYGRLPGHGWVTDLLNSEPVGADALELRPCPEVRLESTA